MSESPLEGLTERETEVLRFVADGLSLPEIAQKLHRSLKTIESHRLSLGRKLGASNRVELARIAIATGLVKVEPLPGDAVPRPDVSALAATELAWLEQINQVVFNASGASFVQRFCDAASRLPGVAIAAICTPDPAHPGGPDPNYRLVLASSERGQGGEPMRYVAMDTPCETILKDGKCCFSEGIAKAYPKDAWLQAVQAESYIGVQLRCPDGLPVGGVGLIGREPLADTKALERVVAFFAPRLASELMLCNEMDMLRSRCEMLESELIARGSDAEAVPDPAPDAVLLSRITRRVESLAGPSYLRGIVDAVCETFAVRAVGVCRWDRDSGGRTVESVTLREADQLTDCKRYQMEGTPCQDVIHSGSVCLASGAIAAYPDDAMLANNGLDAYIGVRLPGLPDGVTGIMWVVDPGPIRAPVAVDRVLRHVAPRVGAELAGLLQMEELMQERERLAAKLKRRAQRA